jgi:hypothetical protein
VIKNGTVFKKIMKLKSNKAAGLDKIPQKLLKDPAVVVTPYLSLIFNLSLSGGNFQATGKMLEFLQFSNLEI